MSKLLWKFLLISPSVLGATLLAVASAMASPQSPSSAAPTPTIAEVPQLQAVETEAPEANSVMTIAPEADAAPVFSSAGTESELPLVASTNTPTQVALTPATVLEQSTVAEKEIPTQVVVTPTQQLVADKPEAFVAQVSETPKEAPSAMSATPAATPATASPNDLKQVNRYSNEGKVNSIAQVTSVSQLSDVQPTDWAFQALQSLVERYGVIAGYPDGTFRGNRAMTRYEFAAGLNAALDRVNELIAAGTADIVSREDLATLQRLQEEFAAELATLRGRVDALEAQTAELEANQFSTTTKLVGEAIFAITDEFSSRSETNTVFQNRVRLDFQTSFGGRDVLHTRLTTSNAVALNFQDDAQPFGTFEGTQTFNIAPNTNNGVGVDWLAYYFPLFGQAQGYIAAVGGIHSDYANTVNPYFEDFDGGNGALSTFATENPIYRIGGGAGGAVNLAFGKGGILGLSSLTLGYLADNANLPGQDFGLGNGDYAALGQLNFNLGDRFAIAATYVHGYHNGGDGIFDIGGSAGETAGAQPIVGTALANDPSLLLGGDSSPLVTNSYGVEAALRVSDKLSLSAFGTYTNVKILGRGSGDVWTYGLGVALPDFGKEGNVLGLFAGIEPTLRGLRVPGAQNFSRDYGFHVEGFYKYRLTDNISITPGVIWLKDPGQNEDNDDALIGTIRTTFNF